MPTDKNCVSIWHQRVLEQEDDLEGVLKAGDFVRVIINFNSGYRLSTLASPYLSRDGALVLQINIIIPEIGYSQHIIIKSMTSLMSTGYIRFKLGYILDAHYESILVEKVASSKNNVDDDF